MALDKVQLFSPTPFIPAGPFASKTVGSFEVLTGTYFCQDFTVPDGVTCYIRDTVYVVARGNVTIDGYMQGEGNTTYPSPPMSYADLGETWTSVDIVPGFFCYGNYNGSGIAGGSTPLGGQASDAIVNLRGSGGASGYLDNTDPSVVYPAIFASGGKPGKTLIIRALGSITVNLGATINCNGGWGQQWNPSVFPSLPATVLSSGAGGGSGGVIILDADEACTCDGSLRALGGNGSDGLNGTLGGGGGGGGIIICQSRFSTVSIVDAFANGGLAGASGGTLLGSGGGGGCGGFGGNGGYGYGVGLASYAAPTNGSAGVVQVGGTPW